MRIFVLVVLLTLNLILIGLVGGLLVVNAIACGLLCFALGLTVGPKA